MKSVILNNRDPDKVLIYILVFKFPPPYLEITIIMSHNFSLATRPDNLFSFFSFSQLIGPKYG